MMLNYFRSSRQGYLPLSESKRPLSPTRAQLEFVSCTVMRAAGYALLFSSLICLGYISGRKTSFHRWQSWHQWQLETPTSTDVSIGSLVIPPKPANTTVVGLVFYGRREYVDVLDCYLRRNLAVNGGYLDSVQFLVHTSNQDDLNYLDELVNSQPGYEKKETPALDGPNYEGMWRDTKDPDTVYIKIDDDIVYIHDEAIPRLVHTLAARPDAVAVGTNTINHAMLSVMHSHTEAIRPFVPEDQANPSENTIDWRVSNLPRFTGDLTELEQTPFEDYWPRKNQRFLPLSNDINSLLKSPYSKVNFVDWWVPWAHWQVAGQAHYSLLHNIEQGQLERYAFGLWNTHFNRYSINFIAIRGKTLAQRPVAQQDDEEEITVTIPKELNRPVLVDTRAVVSHFGYRSQGALLTTDILDRYRLLANERACSLHNQKKDLDVVR